MCPAAGVPAPLRGRVVTRTEAQEHTGARTLRGVRYQRLVRGVYAADLEITHGVRIEGIRKAIGGGPVLVGPSAAWALGAQLAGPRAPVHVNVTSGVRPQEHLVPHRGRLSPDDVVVTPYGRATTPARTCLDLARGLGSDGWSGNWRVAAVDAVLHATGLRAAELRSALAATTDLHGLAAARPVIRAARDGAESVRETLLRLLVVRAGFVEPELQIEVVDADGAFIARLDLGWRDARAAAEYDGAVHREDDRYTQDLRRHNSLRVEGWRVMQVDKNGLARPGRFLRELALIAPRRSA
ncbi:MAG: hypothetical protein ACFCVG_10375 [Kineosporiaceae bacterium]